MLQIFGAKNIPSRALLAYVWTLQNPKLPLPDIAYQSEGKPYFPACPAFHFSLSHTGSLTLCAVDSAPLGVDIEEITPRTEKLIRYTLTDKEYESYKALGETWQSFYSLWTKKEAWCKLTGKGIGATLRTTPPDADFFYRSYCGKTWITTICGSTPPPESIVWLEI